MKGTTDLLNRSKAARLFCLGLTLFLILALPASALAQTTLATVTTNSSGNFETTVTIPSGTTPGTYDLEASGTRPSATPYPPSSAASCSVDRSVVRAGDTIRVFGSGFSPNTTVTLRLQGLATLLNIAQTTQAVATSCARITVVSPTATIPPQPVFPIIGRNQQIPVPVPVPIVVGGGDRGGPIIVNNNNSSSSSSSAAASAGGGGVVAVPTQTGTTPGTLVRTGIEGLPLLAAGLALILLGSVLLSADRRRLAMQGSLTS